MIGQTFALLSEVFFDGGPSQLSPTNAAQHPFHLTTASSYHGTLISVRLKPILAFDIFGLIGVLRLPATLEFLIRPLSSFFHTIYPHRSCTMPGKIGPRERR
jgi:hypothetical protein